MSQIDVDQRNTNALIATAIMYQKQRNDLLAVAEKADELVQTFVGANSPDETYLIYSLPREVQNLVYELGEMANAAIAAAKGEK